MIAVLSKILVIFAMILLGFIVCKAGILPFESNKYLVNLLMLITTPCMIISSMAGGDIHGEALKQTLQVLVLSAVWFVVMSLLAFLFAKFMKRTPKEDLGVLMVIMVAMNSGFMGFPVTRAIFGDYLFLLMVIQNVSLNVYIYFIAPMQANYGHSSSQTVKHVLVSLVNPATIAVLVGMVLMFGGLTLPVPVMEFFTTVGDATIPLSMIIVGIQLANSDFRGVFRNKDLLLTSGINIIGMPLLTFLLVNWLPLAPEVKTTLIFAAAFPCAVASVGIISKEGRNASLAAEGVAVTTALSLITLPIIATLLSSYYGL